MLQPQKTVIIDKWGNGEEPQSHLWKIVNVAIFNDVGTEYTYCDRFDVLEIEFWISGLRYF